MVSYSVGRFNIRVDTKQNAFLVDLKMFFVSLHDRGVSSHRRFSPTVHLFLPEQRAKHDKVHVWTS